MEFAKNKKVLPKIYLERSVQMPYFLWERIQVSSFIFFYRRFFPNFGIPPWMSSRIPNIRKHVQAFVPPKSLPWFSQGLFCRNSSKFLYYSRNFLQIFGNVNMNFSGLYEHLRIKAFFWKFHIQRGLALSLCRNVMYSTIF